LVSSESRGAHREPAALRALLDIREVDAPELERDLGPAEKLILKIPKSCCAIEFNSEDTQNDILIRFNSECRFWYLQNPEGPDREPAVLRTLLDIREVDPAELEGDLGPAEELDGAAPGDRPEVRERDLGVVLPRLKNSVCKSSAL